MKADYELQTLKNGMKVLFVPNKEPYSVTILATIKSGSVLEDKSNQGITHFVEHMALSATKKWNTKSKLNEITEFNGAEFNGSTSREELEYYINIPHNKLDFGMEFIEQALFHSTFNKSYIEQERTVIMDEISKRNDNVNYQNNKFIIDCLTAKKTGYSYDIAGTHDTVANFSRKKLINHYKYAHDPSKILITIIGNFSKAKAVKLIKSHFEKYPSKNKPEELPLEIAKQNIISVRKSKKTDLIMNTIFYSGQNGQEMSTRDGILNHMVIKILSGPMTSRLMKRLREKEGLLYHIGATTITYETIGATFIYYDVSPTIFEQTHKTVVEELYKFSKKGVSKKELDHFKELTINRNLVHYDNIFTYSKLIREPVFHNKKILKLEEINDFIRGMTTKDINKYIKKYYSFNNASFISFGNVQNDTSDILKAHVSNYQ